MFFCCCFVQVKVRNFLKPHPKAVLIIHNICILPIKATWMSVSVNYISKHFVGIDFLSRI